ncbi:MAG: hypothetical protein IPG69_18720 [Flavobacteriales bacterium]|nr:hypothetical protein [Flavobacteriales bacterium]
MTIAGFDPCAPKAVYREFYLSQPAELWVSFENYPWHEAAGFRIFSGRGSLGLGTLSANVVDTNCVGYFFASECNPMPAGWYTVVAYGRGPNYTNNLAFHETSPYGYQNDSDIGNDHRIIVTADTSITPGPLYNRPYKGLRGEQRQPHRAREQRHSGQPELRAALHPLHGELQVSGGYPVGGSGVVLLP